jgi:hypothetical protein
MPRGGDEGGDLYVPAGHDRWVVADEAYGDHAVRPSYKATSLSFRTRNRGRSNDSSRNALRSQGIAVSAFLPEYVGSF